MEDSTADLNVFFTECFNDIQREEERALAKIANDKISLKEIHLIEAVYKAEKQNDTTLGNISRILGISQGSLTIAVNALEKKGYVMRVQNPHDRRSYSLTCTQLGSYINELHIKFHQAMIADIVTLLDKNEITTLCNALKKLHIFFKEKLNKEQK